MQEVSPEVIISASPSTMSCDRHARNAFACPRGPHPRVLELSEGTVKAIGVEAFAKWGAAQHPGAPEQRDPFLSSYHPPDGF